MKYIFISIIALSFYLVSCEPVTPQQSSANSKKILYTDAEYEDIVGNCQILPIKNGQINTLGNPVASLTSTEQLLLRFDLLQEEYENLSFRLIHCNKDWTQSRLRDMEYLSEINDYRITEFNKSVNTLTPYVNYQVALPKPKISGNYLVLVYRRGNKSDILVSRRMLITESAVSLTVEVRTSSSIAKRETHEQIEFTVGYSGLLVNAPTSDITPVVLQNHNWNTARSFDDPTVLRANESIMEFRNQNEQNLFPAGNDYRFTDLRTLDVSGRNVGRINKTANTISSTLLVNEPRGMNTYTQNFQDINGNYLIETRDVGETFLNNDYTIAQFFLRSEQVEGNVFVSGRFNNWRKEDNNLMRYDPTNQLYTTKIRLKQGYYEYEFILENGTKPSYFFEGSYFQAENDYELLVYYRRPGTVNDLLVGYQQFNSL